MTSRYPKQECKSVDLDAQSITFGDATTANFQLLNGMLMGSGFWNRIGQRVSLKSIQMNMEFQWTGSGPAANNSIAYRIILFYDAQSNKTMPAVSDLLLSTLYNSTTATNSQSMINLNNRDRFLIIKDWRFSILAWPTVAQQASSAMWISSYLSTQNHLPTTKKWYIKLNGLETIYNNSTGAIGDINTGALALMILSDVSGANGNPIAMSLTARLRFYD
jgi:hypothetical protein